MRKYRLAKFGPGCWPGGLLILLLPEVAQSEGDAGRRMDNGPPGWHQAAHSMDNRRR